MKRTILLLVTLFSGHAYGWKGTEAKGNQPIFMGVLQSREGNTFNVTNVKIGRSPEGRDRVLLYEMPKKLKQKTSGYELNINPEEELTTAQLELAKIKKIVVPHPNVLWKWKDKDSKRAASMAREYIEVAITWRSGSTINYLIELGPEDTRRPVKIYSDVIDKPLSGIRQDGTLFCPGITKSELRKKGAPFPSVQSLSLDEPCFKVPTENGGTVKPKDQ